MSKKILIFVVIVVIVIAAGISVYFAVFKPSEAPSPNVNNFEECIAAGYPILESYPRQCKARDGKTFFEDIGNELEKQDLIRVSKPRPNDFIKTPLEIEGEARGFWFFEASFPINILDEKGEVVGSGIAQAQSDWMTEEFVPFLAKLEFSPSLSGKSTLVLKKDNPSGLPEYEDELRIPVIFQVVETIKVKVFFNNSRADPEFSCNKVSPVEREIVKTQAVARASLEELLKGPTENEKSAGFFTSINPGVKIQKLTIDSSTDGGVAKIDFDEQLELGVGGSCRVSAIRAQITETLKQFSTVSEVIVSINGRTEDILQP